MPRAPRSCLRFARALVYRAGPAYPPVLQARPPRKAGKNDTKFLTCEKNRISLLIGHTIFFTSEKNRMTNGIGSHQRETDFIQ